ncbi:hypothetical protein M422DRAFT_55155 [Sphaerobolus stellatus SS14]|uniref:Uncharacterized protein n=1 Tax=Sphaerobolus stellatus (strain SS14) TaxID=990650 RepID=A0A0C9UDU5_SPHS4|nr:hypothetical protein M422DRAFT_55155 [Sphaerobolus stellatus SS14]
MWSASSPPHQPKTHDAHLWVVTEITTFMVVWNVESRPQATGAHHEDALNIPSIRSPIVAEFWRFSGGTHMSLILHKRQISTTIRVYLSWMTVLCKEQKQEISVLLLTTMNEYHVPFELPNSEPYNNATLSSNSTADSDTFLTRYESPIPPKSHIVNYAAKKAQQQQDSLYHYSLLEQFPSEDQSQLRSWNDYFTQSSPSLLKRMRPSKGTPYYHPYLLSAQEIDWEVAQSKQPISTISFKVTSNPERSPQIIPRQDDPISLDLKASVKGQIDEYEESGYGVLLVEEEKENEEKPSSEEEAQLFDVDDNDDEKVYLAAAQQTAKKHPHQKCP